MRPGHLRRRGEDRHHSGGAGSHQEAVRQEGNSARRLDPRADRFSGLKREVTDEETHHRDSGEGRSSRSHSLPHGHHNHELYGLRTSPTLLAETRES